MYLTLYICLYLPRSKKKSQNGGHYVTKQPKIPLRIIHISEGGLQKNLVFIASETDRGQWILKLNFTNRVCFDVFEKAEERENYPQEHLLQAVF